MRPDDSQNSDLEARVVAQAALLFLGILNLVVLSLVFGWG
jgi:hypothetical protein